jgi:hypothetical protein
MLRRERSTLLERKEREHAAVVERLVESTSQARERDDVALSTRYDECLQRISADMERARTQEMALARLVRVHKKEKLRRAALEIEIEKMMKGRDQNVELYTKTSLEKIEQLDEIMESNREREQESLKTEKMLIRMRREELNKYNDILVKMKQDRVDKLKETKLHAVESLKVASAGIMRAIEEDYVEVLTKMDMQVQEKESQVDRCTQAIIQKEQLLESHKLALANIQTHGVQEILKREEMKLTKKSTMRQLKLHIQDLWTNLDIGFIEKIRFFETLTGTSGTMLPMPSVLELWSDERKRMHAGRELEQMVPEWRRTIRLVLFMEHLVNHSNVHHDAATIMHEEMISCGLAIPIVLVESHHHLFLPKASSNRSSDLTSYKEELTSLEPQYTVLLQRKQRFEAEMMKLLLKFKEETGNDFCIVDGEHYVDTGSHAMMVPLEKVLTGLTFDEDGNDQTNVVVQGIKSPTARHSSRRASAVLFEEKIGVSKNQKTVSTDGFVHAVELVRLETDERFKIKAAIHGSIYTEKCLLRISKKMQENARRKLRG